jgi:hypothetical protein
VRQVAFKVSAHRRQQEEDDPFARIVLEFVLTGEIAGMVRGGRQRSHG